MTFDEVMKQVQGKGSYHQEELKKALNTHEFESSMTFKTINTGYSAFITVTAEQFLAIYKILGNKMTYKHKLAENARIIIEQEGMCHGVFCSDCLCHIFNKSCDKKTAVKVCQQWLKDNPDV